MFGVMVGGSGVGAIVIAAGEPYYYSTLRPSICAHVKQDPASLWAGEIVPDQDDPCFVRYPQYPRWLMLSH